MSSGSDTTRKERGRKRKDGSWKSKKKKGATNRRNHAMEKTDMAQQKAVCGRPGSRKIERLSVLMTTSFSLPRVSRGPVNERISPRGPMRAQKDRVSASTSALVIKGATRSGSCGGCPQVGSGTFTHRCVWHQEGFYKHKYTIVTALSPFLDGA